MDKKAKKKVQKRSQNPVLGYFIIPEIVDKAASKTLQPGLSHIKSQSNHIATASGRYHKPNPRDSPDLNIKLNYNTIGDCSAGCQCSYARGCGYGGCAHTHTCGN